MVKRRVRLFRKDKSQAEQFGSEVVITREMPIEQTTLLHEGVRYRIIKDWPSSHERSVGPIDSDAQEC
jgi:hypothetical protein